MFRVPVVQRSASTTTRVARPAKGVVTLSRSEYRSIPLSRLEITLIEREKAHRQRVVRALIEGKRAVRPQPQQHTRAGRAQDFQNAQRHYLERRVRDIGIRLGLR